MSASYDAGVVLGVKLSEIGFNAELVSVPYEIHDKRGKPTGKFENEKSWKVSFQGNDVPYEHGERLYLDVIEKLIGVKDPLCIFDNRDWEEEQTDTDKIIIGVEIANIDYNDYCVLKELKTEEKFKLAKSELKNQFGVDVEPKLYFYFKVS